MFKTAPSKNSQGYTLIEILVTVSIIGLIFSFGYVSYRDFARRQSLLGVTRRIKADLSLAQEQALAGEKPEGIACSGEGTLNGYDFYAESATSYLIQANCTGGLVDEKHIFIDSEIIMEVVPERFTFKVIGKGTSLGSPATITLTQSATGDTQVIIVTPEGEIE